MARVTISDGLAERAGRPTARLALRITSQGSVEDIDLTDEPERVVTFLVGAFAHVVETDFGHLWVNPDATSDMQPNEVGSLLADRPILGDAVLTGHMAGLTQTAVLNALDAIYQSFPD